MSTPAEVQEFVVSHLKARYPKASAVNFNAGTNLIASGLLDSFAFLDLVTVVEKQFNAQVDLGSHEFEVISTLGGLCNAVVQS
jgi:acyl carrier protein